MSTVIYSTSKATRTLIVTRVRAFMPGVIEVAWRVKGAGKLSRRHALLSFDDWTGVDGRICEVLRESYHATVNVELPLKAWR